jgi:alginate O-acetyltransferase complex protein AlgI
MVFSSYEFIFGFLPACLVGYAVLLRWGGRQAALWFLTVASFVFYAFAGWFDLGLLVASIIGNFLAGQFLARPGAHRRPLLVAAIAANLAGIAFFKYSAFGASLVGLNASLPLSHLPLGISFYTFVQITYLVDVSRGAKVEPNLMRYALFVTFFPHLIAGPIIHHGDLLPQFSRAWSRLRGNAFFAAGLTIFAIGLAKKVVLADPIAPYANAVFDGAAAGQSVGFIDGWLGTLSYTFQLYFDFSGYSDMAIGLAAMFSVRLPVNFFSPYKSSSITAFWRRWHMTLSRFLRDYVYIALGGNRVPHWRRLINLFLTMLIGGLWHGAGWTFVTWGALHGAMLVANQWFAASRLGASMALPRPVSVGVTFLIVALSWVLFRAQDMNAAGAVYSGMFGLTGLSAIALPTDLPRVALHLGALSLIVFLCPNTSQIMRKFDPGIIEYSGLTRTRSWVEWRPGTLWGMAVGLAVVASLALLWSVASVAPFLYFNF